MENDEEVILNLTMGVLKGAFGELATDIVAEGMVCQLVPEIMREVAQAGVESLASPLLRVLLHITDSTTKKLDTVLREPFRTGSREAKDAMAVCCTTAKDIERQEERLKQADAKLAEAFSVAESLRGQGDKLFYICFLRGLISIQLGSPAFAHYELTRCLNFLSPTSRISRIEHELDDQVGTLRRSYEHPGYKVMPGMPQFIKNIEEIIAKLVDEKKYLQETVDYIQATIASLIIKPQETKIKKEDYSELYPYRRW